MKVKRKNIKETKINKSQEIEKDKNEITVNKRAKPKNGDMEKRIIERLNFIIDEKIRNLFEEVFTIFEKKLNLLIQNIMTKNTYNYETGNHNKNNLSL